MFKLSKNQILLFGLCFHVLAAYFSVGFYQADEKFQIFEFAGYKLGINPGNTLPWEFQFQMRPALQPLIVFLFTRLGNFLSLSNPFTIAFIIRLMQSLLSFAALVYLLRYFEKELHSEKLKLQLWVTSCLLWCLPYLHARFSSEMFSATLFIFGFALAMNALSGRSKTVAFVVPGFLFGLAFVTRFQVAFMLAGFLAWLVFIQKVNVKTIGALIVGIGVAIGFGAIVDKWFYGKWVLTGWHYLDVNFVQNKAAQFGESPFYFYPVEALVHLIPPYSFLIFVAVGGFWYLLKKHVITWLTLPFVILHFFVAHKELRFLFPVVNFFPLMFILFYEKVSQARRWQWFISICSNKFFIKSAIVVNCMALIFFTFKPCDETTNNLKFLYDLPRGTNTILLFESINPYSSSTELNYFRNPKLKAVHVDSLNSRNYTNENLYYYNESASQPQMLIKNNYVFLKFWSKYPAWISVFNFNGWFERSGNISIYRQVK